MPEVKSPENNDDSKTPLTSASKFPGGDYFSISLHRDGHRTIPGVSPNRHRLPSSPISPSAGAALSSSNPSRGSWSSLFNTGSVRQFMSGMQDTIKDGLATPAGDTLTALGAPIPVPGGQKGHWGATSPRYGIDGSHHSTTSTSKSWADVSAPSSTKAAITFSSAGHVRRATLSQVASPRIVIPEKKLLVFDEIAEER